MVFACALAAPLLAPSLAAAAGNPNIALSASAPAEVLRGAPATITLTASNPEGQPTGYNVSYRAVLPVGVHYAGHAEVEGEPVAPQVIENAPAAGETTLLWVNVGDLPAKSESQLSFRALACTVAEASCPTPYPVGSTFKVAGGAYVSEFPRIVPKFTAKGEPIGPSKASFTGFATGTTTTEIAALEVTQSENSPEGKILRGVHDHQVVYTVHVKNNQTGPTTGAVVEEFLPAGLEYLGCATNTDHTTEAPTNPGSKEEYPGSGLIEVQPVSGCEEPAEVITEEVDPDGAGPLPKAVYTRLVWHVGTLEKEAEKSFSFRAAIPLRENTLSWPHGEPTPASRGQSANLDNNSGKETRHNQSLTTYARASGKYEGVTESTSENHLTRIAKDLIIEKEASSGVLEPGEVTLWTLHLHSSEYRYNTELEVLDTLPSGLCALAETNLSPTKSPECEPTGLAEDNPSPAFSSAEEEPGGTWKLVWHLEKIGRNESSVITFASKTRANYQLGPPSHGAGTPILSEDSVNNTAAVNATTNVICAGPPNNCTSGTPIDHERPLSEKISDESAAGQKAAPPTARKEVAESGPECQTAKYTTAEPTYRPGDLVCWLLTVEFPQHVETKGSVLTDFIPVHGIFDEEFNGGKGEAATKADTLPEASFDHSEAGNKETGGEVNWTLSKSGFQPGKAIFQRVIATEATITPAAKLGELQGNLMTFAVENTPGHVFSLRSSANFKLEYPALSVTKQIVAVDGKAVTPTSKLQVEAGSEVTYELKLKNTGSVEAEGVQLRDLLPAAMTCADFISATQGGECTTPSPEFVHWGETTQKQISVPAKGETPLQVVMRVPENAGPATEFEDKAGVREFSSATNTGGTFTYVPSENIDPTLDAEANSPEINKPTALVYTKEVEISKSHTTSRVEPGNNAESATIGEIATFEVPVTVPAGITLGGKAELTDKTIGSTGRWALIKGSTTLKLFEGKTEVPATGFFVGEEVGVHGNAPILEFPANYKTPAATPVTAIMRFEARVTNSAENLRGASIPNTAKLAWTDPIEKAAREKTSKVDNTPVVEPKISLTDTNSSKEKKEPVKGGDIVEYKLTVANSSEANVSAAFNTTLVAEVATGVTPTNKAGEALKNGETTESGGTWNETARTITWTIAKLAPGASEKLTYFAKVDEKPVSGSELKDSAVATTESQPKGEEGSRNASTSPSKAIKGSYEAKASGELEVAGPTVIKTVTPTKATIGNLLTYTLEVTLPANVVSYDTTVIDQLPSSIDFVEYGTETCTSGCPPNLEELATYTPKLTAEGTTKVAWWIGNLPATSEARVLKLTFVAAIRSKRHGGKEEAVVGGEKLTNTASVKYDKSPKKKFEEGNIPTEFEHESAPGEAKVEIIEPALSIVKEAAVEGGKFSTETFKLQVGQKVHYRILVTNTGKSPAYDATIVDAVPKQLSAVVAATPPPGVTITKAWSEAKPEIEWQVEDSAPIAPKGSITLEYTGTLTLPAKPEQGEAITNTASISSYWGASETERDAGHTNFKKEMLEYREYTGPKASVTGNVELPALELTKVPAKTTYAAGEEASYAITVKDTNKAPANNVYVEDSMPAGMTYAAGTATAVPSAGFSEVAATSSSATWKIALINPGASVTITVPSKIAPTVAPGTELTNLAGLHFEEVAKPLTAEATIKVTGSADLAIVKTASPKPVVAGNKLKYTLAVTNAGPSEAKGVKVTDPLPATVTYDSGAAGCSYNAGTKTVTCEAASLAVHGEKTFEVEVTVSHEASGTIENTATVTSETPDPDPANNKSTDKTNVVGEADLEIEKTASRSPAIAGEPLTYKLAVTNKGPSDATNVKVTDVLPEGLTYESSSAGCSYTEGTRTLTCTTASLAAGAKTTFEVTALVDPEKTGTLENTARVESETPDPHEENNKSTLKTPVEGSADLSIVKTASPEVAVAGEDLTYTLVVKNAGPSDAIAVKVSDHLPANASYVSSSAACKETAGTVTCEAPSLAVGHELTYEVKVQVKPSATVDVENTATVTSETPDPEEANNHSTVKTPLNTSADVSIKKSAPAEAQAGTNLTYTLLVKNAGPSHAQATVVTDELPAGVAFVSATSPCTYAAPTVTCNLGTLPAGDEQTLEIVVHIPSTFSGKLENTATVKSETPDPEEANNTSTVTTEVDDVVNLFVVKSGPATVAPGAEITWQIEGGNHGPGTATEVKLADPLPHGVHYIRSTISKGSCEYSAPTLTCHVGTLEPGETVHATIVARVLRGPGTLTNTATIEANEHAASSEGTAHTKVLEDPHVKITKSPDRTNAMPGERVRYSLKVHNPGPGVAYALRTCDTIPRHTTIASAGGGSVENGAVCWRLARLSPRASHTYRLVLRLDSNATGTVVNHAAVTGLNFRKSSARASVKVVPHESAAAGFHAVTG